MDKIFLQLLNMSAAAGWLVLAVMVLRFFMKKAPRWLTCILWGIVAVRLVCPFFLESPLSLIPSSQLISPYEVQYGGHPAVTSGIPALNSIVNPVLSHSLSPAPGASVNPLHVWMTLAGVLWFSGFLALLFHALASFLRIRRIVEESVPLQDNVRLCDHIGSPFILGILRPKIYLPSGIDRQELPLVLAHEHAHLKRRDHWWKPLGYLLLSVYWFHPLIWAAYVLFCRDIELACDENVIRDMKSDEKKAYSHALVSLSLRRRLISACPLAFGESSIKDRVNTVLHYKKPAFWVIGAAGAACLAAAVCFLTNPVEKNHMAGDDTMVQYEGQWYPKEALSEDTLRWLEMYNRLPPEKRLALSYVPWDLYELSGHRDGSNMPVTVETSPESPNSRTDQDPLTNQGSKELQTDQEPRTDREPQANQESKEPETGREQEDETHKDTEEAPRSDLDQAICRAIMEHYKHSYRQVYDFACCDFLMLEMVSGTPKADGSAHTVICYGWTLYQQYTISQTGLESAGGCHVPAALTFETDQDQYILKEYWTPGDGSYFVSDIQNKFPSHLADDGIDSQKYIIRQQQSCYSQAVRAAGLDTEPVISQLLEDLSSGLGSSFHPQSIATQQNSQYRELIKYGEYTLAYFLNRFEHGGEPDPKGRIMALICEELLRTRDTLPLNASDAADGRLWYDTLRAHAPNLVTPYLKEE